MKEIVDFPSVLRQARELFESRTQVLIPEKERKNYRTQKYSPRFTFGISGNKVVCKWIGNFRKDRKGRPKLCGTCTVFSEAETIAPFRYLADEINEGFTPKEWDRIGLELIYLHEQLK